MKSSTPKVLHKLCGRPILSYVLDLVGELKIKNTVCVLGHKSEEVKKILPPGIKAARQARLVGTADAVKCALAKLSSFKGSVLILYGDIPLLKKETIKELLEYHLKNGLDATMLTATLNKPDGYGRVLRDKYSSLRGIVEEKDANDFQKGLKEINTGIICFKKDKLAAALKQVKARNKKNEFYLTDVIAIMYQKGLLLDTVTLKDINEAIGINSRVELAKADCLMRQRINEKLMLAGVTIIDPRSTFVNFGAKIGPDTLIYPFTVIENDVKIGARCFIGPFAHLREGTRLESDVVAGNFLEIVRSKISKNTWMKHFCYLGDSRVGRGANIGAGAVVANFDGSKKNNTVIGDGAFIGSDSVLVAPVKVGRGAKTGAGAVVKNNVAPHTVVAGVPARLLVKK